MYTAKEIRDKEFERSSRGYRSEDVDSFLSEVANQMEALIAEKNENQSKMLMLAEKIEQYRSEEDVLRSALISAERMKDSILTEAQQQKEIVIRDAQQKAERILEDARKGIDREEITLQALKQQVSAFKSEVLNIYKAHLEILSDLPEEQLAAQNYGDTATSNIFSGNTQPASTGIDPIFQAEPAFAYPAQPEQAVAPEQKVANFEPAPQPTGEFAFQPMQPAAELPPTFDFSQQPAPAAEPSPYEGFAPRAFSEEAVPEQPAAVEPDSVFASFGNSEPAPDTKREESRFERLDFGENFSFGRD